MPASAAYAQDLTDLLRAHNTIVAHGNDAATLVHRAHQVAATHRDNPRLDPNQARMHTAADLADLRTTGADYATQIGQITDIMDRLAGRLLAPTARDHMGLTAADYERHRAAWHRVERALEANPTGERRTVATSAADATTKARALIARAVDTGDQATLDAIRAELPAYLLDVHGIPMPDDIAATLNQLSSYPEITRAHTILVADEPATRRVLAARDAYAAAHLDPDALPTFTHNGPDWTAPVVWVDGQHPNAGHGKPRQVETIYIGNTEPGPAGTIVG